MGQNSAIEWTDHTFNPWWGCVKVSPGCKNCYAETWATRYAHDVWGPRANRRTFGEKHWHEPLKWNRDAEKAGINARVFCGSMCDIFEQTPNTDLDTERQKLWSLIERTPWLSWLLLTKRPENIHGMLPDRWSILGYGENPPVPRNIWLGISAENQEEFDARWPILVSLAPSWPVANLFISAEPLLGPLDLSAWIEEWQDDDGRTIRGIDWVITGGESGHQARPMHPAWPRSLRIQCLIAGVPFFFKQWGEWAPAYELDHDPELQARILLGRIQEHEFRIGVGGERLTYRVGKTAAGSILDGQQWKEFPEG